MKNMGYLGIRQSAPAGYPSGNFAPRIRVAAKLAAISVGAMGALSLIGWWLGIGILRSMFSGIPIKPNIAAFLVISGGSLALLAFSRPTRLSRFCAVTLSGVVVCFSLLTLVESIVAVDLKIDNLITAGCAAPTDDWQWRMMPGTAFSFMLIAIALFLATGTPTRLRLWLVSGLSASQLIPAVIALAGLFAQNFLGSHWNLMGMSRASIPVAVTFILLSAGLLGVMRNFGFFSWSLDALTTIGFAAGVLIMLATPASSFNFAKQMLETNRAIGHRQEALKEIEEVAAGIADLASSERGYVITGDASLLADREAKAAQVREDIDDTQKLTADEENQQHDVKQLRQLASQRFEWQNTVIRARQEKSATVASKLVASGPGTRFGEQITALLKTMRQKNTTYSHRTKKTPRALRARRLFCCRWAFFSRWQYSHSASFS